VNKNSSGFAIW